MNIEPNSFPVADLSVMLALMATRIGGEVISLVQDNKVCILPYLTCTLSKFTNATVARHQLGSLWTLWAPAEHLGNLP